MTQISNIVSLAACVCAQDGIISETELDAIREMVSEKFSQITKDDFNSMIDNFFLEDKSLETYYENLQSSEDLNEIINICHASAASDGLEPRENIALIKLIRLAGQNPEEYFKDA